MERALSRHAVGREPSPAVEECAGRHPGGGGGGRGSGALAVTLAGAGDRAEGTGTPGHISPCGRPAAQISYLKPGQIGRGQEAAGM